MTESKYYSDAACEQCGNRLVISNYRRKMSKSGYFFCGPQCMGAHSTGRSRTNGERLQGDRPVVPNALWLRLQNNAKSRNIAVNITISALEDAYVEQEGKCALTGRDLIFSPVRSATASVDRIDSSKPYEVGNIQWLHKQVNFMKWAIPQDQFIAMCKKVSEHASQ